MQLKKNETKMRHREYGNKQFALTHLHEDMRRTIEHHETISQLRHVLSYAPFL
jgi:hypothetical protein